MTDEAFMELALQEARVAAQEDEVPVGAVLVGEDGTVLSKAHNQTIGLCDPTAHAEILAVRSAARLLGNYRLKGTTLYVTIEPCTMCMGALIHARVARLMFGAVDPKGGAAGTCFTLQADPRLNHSIDVHGGVLEEECKALIRSFFQNKRRTDAASPTER
jgi:tRNA(adenine34) deaminase